ncbi:MAG: DMT family transporter [Gammaproteobacteria bacterium]
MPIVVAFLAVILIWSTTPLAIQWSSEGGGFLFGVAARMWLGALFCLAFMGLFSVPLPRHRAALRTYVAAGFGIYGALSCVYWSAQFIPSGLISVLYGLTPLVTGLLAALWLQEKAFSPARIAGMLLGFGGLLIIFGQSLIGQPLAFAGMLGVLLSVVLHSVSSVWVKRIAAGIPAMAVAGGGLLVAAPLYLVTWLILGGHAPHTLSTRAGLAILYLSLMGSVAGFVLFYYLLQHLSASRTALITLIAPVIALGLGQALNHEHIAPRTVFGAALILGGLALHQWGDEMIRRRWRRNLPRVIQ